MAQASGQKDEQQGPGRKGVWSLLADRGGQSAIEFTLLLPLMALMFAGTVDLGEGLMVQRKINQIAEVASDIVAQEASWNASDLRTLLEGTAAIITPFDSTELDIQVAIVDFDAAGNASVNWSRAYQADQLASGTPPPFDIPDDVVESGVQLVIAKVDYTMTTPFTSLLSSITGNTEYSFVGKAISRPRVGDKISLK